MKERNRINVLLSRAKNGLYVVRNKTWVDSLPRSEAKFLLKFQSEYRSVTRKMNVPTSCRWYQPGQVDVGQEADQEPEPADQEEQDDGPALETAWDPNLPGVVTSETQASEKPIVTIPLSVNAEPSVADIISS